MEIETNIKSTLARSDKNRKYGTFDYDSFLLKALKLKENMKVLDIGCGTGKHIFPIFESVLPLGFVMGTEIDDECVEFVKREIEKPNTYNLQIKKLFHIELDKIKIKFDRVLSSYSIYYSKDMEKTVKDIYNLLKEKGLFLIFGADKGNNKEILNLLHSLNIETDFEYSKWFNRFILLKPRLQDYFKVTEHHLENIIKFPNKKELLDYLKHTKLCEKHIDRITPFINFKNITKKILFYECIKKEKD